MKKQRKYPFWLRLFAFITFPVWIIPVMGFLLTLETWKEFNNLLE